MGLLYTDEVPTIPGFYFQRQRGGVRVIELPYCGQWPRHWRDKKQDGINAVEDEHTRAAAQALPDSSWITEWAGPIDHPEN
ncbi:hypothetical protein [Pseudomonas serbica]|uniref:hypothetical protein n=1 Tax=Pseudomonas serbica TaxID=2965074 RepID=UPI00237A1EE2|nr:hypothetical protein [Pseudomonas serbica]